MMKRGPTIFLQGVIVLLGIVLLAALIRLPLVEGRAANLDLLSIYLDPFILYGYAASTAFFVALYKVFKLLGYVTQNSIFSQKSVRTMKSVKQCTIALSTSIVTAGLYIKLFHHKEDDPAGFLAICIVATLATIVVSTAAAVFEKILQNGVNIKLENEQLISGHSPKLTL